ncbi:protein phosphatase 1 regulatory subunit 3A [Trichechus manatus latirostris]|uniref:Protein phosphatase 1 regulatory subunit 3A n=1 Tax=Trichechus manatus latirostris TaxID=127582 RepID=A0A2Y9DYA1_TRIMA|nr:protein phosphatase 1 regulatory subunit 3A [Trichechus manatus latirostris]
MEPSEEPSQISKDNFLEVPNLSDSLSEDEEVKPTFKAGFSPQPSRRGSESSEDMYVDTPSSGSRRVSFADTFGFNLVSVKEFDCWELPSGSTNLDLSKDIFHMEEYVLSPLFDLPSSKEDLMQKLQVQKAVLESTEYLPGSTSMKGIIRVLNISFQKLVYVRMSLDDWQTYYDILAEYVPNSCDGETDQFTFKIVLVPPYQKDGSRVEFCIRYETSVGTFWSNNNGINYTLVCQKKEQELEPVKPKEEVSSKHIKGCLKIKSRGENHQGIPIKQVATCSTCYRKAEFRNDRLIVKKLIKEVTFNWIFLQVKDSALKLQINERLIQTRSTPPRDEKNTFSTDPVDFPNKAEGLEKKKIHGEICTDLFKRRSSPSSSAESSLKGNFYRNEKYSSGNECSYQPSEEITSGMGEIKPSLGDANSDELVQLCINSKEKLDDNANPAQERRRVQISCPFSDQLMASTLKKKRKGEAKKIEIKDQECLKKDFHLDESAYLEESTGKGSSRKDYGSGKDEEEQKIHLSLHEKGNNFQSTLHDQERKVGHPEVSVEVLGASSRDLTALSSKESTVPSQAITADTFPSPRTHLSWEEVVLTTPERDFTTAGGTTLGGMPGQVCSPRNENSFKNDYPFQVVEEKSDCINPEDQNKNTQHKHSWNVLESQGKARGSKTNITEQITEQADCEDVWEKRDNTRSLKGTPTEELFTCQETASCELSSLADHGITEKAEAGTACIIKTTSESTLESMSAREKAIIAKLPQETARSDRPIEEKETAFDPHEGRNDDSHYTLCQRDTVGVIHDNDFEKESHSDICNVHVDEMEKEETMCMYNPGKTHDREKSSIGNITSVEESLQVLTGNRKTASKRDSHLEMLPTDEKMFPENRDDGKVQELSTKIDLDVLAPSAFNSDTNKSSQNGSHISNHHTKTSEQSLAPVILISEPFESKEEARHGNEGLLNSEPSLCSSGDKEYENSASASPPAEESQAQSSESLLSKYINSKIPYFLLFLIFLVTIYHYDLMIGLAFYLFSLYWLFWEEGRQKESVKKK